MAIVQHREGDHPADFRCAQAGCGACLERFLRQHEPLIHFITRRQWPGRADYADLIQEGRIGLWQAIVHFDPGRGYAFSTFAGCAIRHRVWHAVKRAGKAHGGVEAQRAGDSLSVLLTDWQQEQEHQALADELGGLPERLRQVIELACGWGGPAPLSLAAIGRRWGVTRERVRQLHEQGLALLRLPAFSLRLRSLCAQDSRRAYRQARRSYDALRRRRRASR
jgi:RNA polymerase sigma factor (sigma-70 family)